MDALTAELYSKQGNIDTTELADIGKTTQCGKCKEHNAKRKSFCTRVSNSARVISRKDRNVDRNNCAGSDACGMMTYSEVSDANFESGTWIIYDGKLLNLENLEVENDTNNAIHIFRNLYPHQPVDPDASIERKTWMAQNKEIVA